jgi:hypothetical protein
VCGGFGEERVVVVVALQLRRTDALGTRGRRRRLLVAVREGEERVLGLLLLRQRSAVYPPGCGGCSMLLLLRLSFVAVVVAVGGCR